MSQLHMTLWVRLVCSGWSAESEAKVDDSQKTRKGWLTRMVVLLPNIRTTTSGAWSGTRSTIRLSRPCTTWSSSSRNMGRMSPMPFTAESVADGRKNEGSAWSSSLYRLCSNNENPEEACKGCVAHRKAWNNGIQ